MQEKKTFELNSLTLHLLAVAFMLCDHLWATVVPGNDWLTCVGRLAFPLFAFMIVEGYFHTHDLKKYVGRLLVFALLSEVPFDLVMGGTVFFPLHQNVMWTFLIGIGLIWLNEKARAKGKLWLRVLTAGATLCLGFLLGILAMVDYFAAGPLTVLVFYFFRGRKWWCLLGQIVLLGYINIGILGGLTYEVELFGRTVYLVQQGLALLALIPIWLYRGKQGPHSKAFQYACYAFYPVHLLILALIQRIWL